MESHSIYECIPITNLFSHDECQAAIDGRLVSAAGGQKSEERPGCLDDTATVLSNGASPVGRIRLVDTSDVAFTPASVGILFRQQKQCGPSNVVRIDAFA